MVPLTLPAGPLGSGKYLTEQASWKSRTKDWKKRNDNQGPAETGEDFLNEVVLNQPPSPSSFMPQRKQKDARTTTRHKNALVAELLCKPYYGRQGNNVI